MTRQQLITNLRALESSHTSGRSHELKCLELRIAGYNKQDERANKVRRALVIEERRNAGMAELVDARKDSGHRIISPYQTAEVIHAGSNPVPRTNLGSELMEGLRCGRTHSSGRSTLVLKSQAECPGPIPGRRPNRTQRLRATDRGRDGAGNPAQQVLKPCQPFHEFSLIIKAIGGARKV